MVCKDTAIWRTTRTKKQRTRTWTTTNKKEKKGEEDTWRDRQGMIYRTPALLSPLSKLREIGNWLCKNTDGQNPLICVSHEGVLHDFLPNLSSGPARSSVLSRSLSFHSFGSIVFRSRTARGWKHHAARMIAHNHRTWFCSVQNSFLWSRIIGYYHSNCSFPSSPSVAIPQSRLKTGELFFLWSRVTGFVLNCSCLSSLSSPLASGYPLLASSPFCIHEWSRFTPTFSFRP